jgi:starch-binding outer membrane protein, SusD/RagB family
MLLRLADIHLVRAEALARREQWNDALTDINKVRERTGLTEIKNVSQDSVIRAIAHERQVELFCEWGNRWYDLKRTNRIDAVLGTEKTTWRPAAALFPIPTAELQANPALTPNPN